MDYFAEEDVPLPLDRTKHIIRKRSDEDLDPPAEKANSEAIQIDGLKPDARSSTTNFVNDKDKLLRACKDTRTMDGLASRLCRRTGFRLSNAPPTLTGWRKP